MIFVLDATNKALKFTVSAGTDVHFTSHWADATTSGLTEGQTQGTSNGSTAVDAVAAPAASTRRVVKLITFHNTNTTTSRTVTLVNDVGGTSRTIAVFTLAPLATWYSDTAATTAIADGDKGDITVSGSGATWTIDNAVVTLAKMADLATDRLIGRDSSGTGVPESLTVGGGIEFTGSGGIQTSAFTGDVTKTAGGTSTTIANDVVTFAKMQNMAADRVLGRRSTTGDPEELTLTQTLDLVGSAARGDLLYRGASSWARLAAGSQGQVVTMGSAGDPVWATNAGAYVNLLINGAMQLTNYRTASLQVSDSGGINSTATTINAGSPGNNLGGSNAAFPASGVLRINNELIQYSSKTVYSTASSFTVATGGRGFDGTTAAAHAQGDRIFLAPYRLGITASGYYTADRWRTHVNGSAGTWTQAVVNDAPSGTLFRRSLRMSVTTANATLDAGDIVRIEQLLEGQNLQHLLKGTSAAKQLTLSFWVKSSVTGTYIVELIDNNNTRRVSASYSISASNTNTWQEVVITFPADTSGVLTNDNGYSLGLAFWLAAGSTYTGGSPLQTSWGTATNTRATGQTNLSATIGNSWQITGVQLQVGPTKSEFENLHINDVSALCARYYRFFPQFGVDGYAAAPSDSGDVSTNFFFVPAMRAAPTITSGDIGISSNTGLTSFKIAVNGGLPAFATTDTYALFQVTPTAIGRAFLYTPLIIDAELTGGN